MPAVMDLLKFELFSGSCISFSIFIISVFSSKDKNITRLTGFIYLFPFLGGIIALTENSFNKMSFLQIITINLMLLFFVLPIIINKVKKAFNFIRNITVLGVIIYAFQPMYLNLTKISSTFYFILLSILVILAFLCMFYTRTNKNNSYIFWSSLLLIASFLIFSAPQLKEIRFVGTISYVSAFMVVLVHIYKLTLSKLKTENAALSERIAEIDKNLDYEVKKRTLEIEKSNRKLISISKTDSLTNSYNKAAILDIIDKLFLDKRIKEFSILMFDIDKFKGINDTYGHLTGDKCIKTLAHLALGSIRDIDSLGRYGGDEFIIVLPSANMTQARVVAERFRSKVEETNSPNFTISIGVASFPGDGNNLKEIINSADEGLYQSKRKGRNAVSHREAF